MITFYSWSEIACKRLESTINIKKALGAMRPSTCKHLILAHESHFFQNCYLDHICLVYSVCLLVEFYQE